jgi:error-prone DNA polymerase
MTEQQEVHADYQMQGLSLRGHPISFLRSWLENQSCKLIAELEEIRSGRFVRLAGLVLLRQRPGTAKGITFVTIEDETGQANLIIHPGIWKRFIRVAQTSDAWIILGRVEKSDRIIHVIVNKLEDCSEALQLHQNRSRNFR